MALEKLQNADFVRRAQANFDTIGERGKYTCVADDDTANLVDIATGKADATAFFVQIFRAGVDVHADAVITLTAGTLRVADGGATYAVTAGDVIVWAVF